MGHFPLANDGIITASIEYARTFDPRIGLSSSDFTMSTNSIAKLIPLASSLAICTSYFHLLSTFNALALRITLRKASSICLYPLSSSLGHFNFSLTKYCIAIPLSQTGISAMNFTSSLNLTAFRTGPIASFLMLRWASDHMWAKRSFVFKTCSVSQQMSMSFASANWCSSDKLSWVFLHLLKWTQNFGEESTLSNADLYCS